MALRSLRLSLRFVLPLALALGLIAFAVIPLVDKLTLRWFVNDLDARSQLLATTLQEPLAEYIPSAEKSKIDQLFERTIRDQHLYAIAFCNTEGKLLYRTDTYPSSLNCAKRKPGDLPLRDDLHITEAQIDSENHHLGKLVLVHDMSLIESRIADAEKYVITLFAMLTVTISLITVFIAHLSWRGWINSAKELLRGGLQTRNRVPKDHEIQPLVGDLRAILRESTLDRKGFGNSAQVWTPDKLRSLLRAELLGDEILVVSNREPYIHIHTDRGIEVQRPASGLVTAVEPVMRACSGTWIAHGVGSADREVVDRDDCVMVPPEHPSYTLRRIWLSEEEERGFYYGFANEGIWPLCHIAHVRPVFRTSDWEQYVRVNQRFADVVVAEARTDNPVILAQDYHFALLPRMVRDALPKATIITFWHIPWPNPESFGICPWREEIIEGLLGSTILGFHTAFHCKNFIETVDRYLETRIEHEDSTIRYGGKITQVEHYPISIAWPEQNMSGFESIAACRAAIRSELNLPAGHLLGVGVDRLDYTKGIIERMQAVQTMLEQHPEFVGCFSLLQIAAPSRSSLNEYQSLEVRVKELAAAINAQFSNATHPPIRLSVEHHDFHNLNRYYRAADACLVTSLHDGMNLVAKEFIAARDDEHGVLILSQFTGAARELHEALIVNPYHVEQSADALYQALTMPENEQRERMRSMRLLVKDFNVYRWAGRMLLDAATLRRRERISEKICSQRRKNLRGAAAAS